MIRMRVNKSQHTHCICCKQSQENSILMFDLNIGDIILTICDKCNDELFNKSLRASCMTNSKLKSPQDLKIIRNRNLKNRN